MDHALEASSSSSSSRAARHRNRKCKAVVRLYGKLGGCRHLLLATLREARTRQQLALQRRMGVQSSA